MIENDRKQDELLAIRCQLGEPSAFDALIARWHEPLWKYLRRLAGDDDAAAEAVQDVWLRILRGIARLRDGSRLRAWIFGIARRVAMDRLREKYAEPVLVSIDDRDLVGADDTSELKEDIALMHVELARLPVPEREVLVLFHLEELTLAEIAEVIGIPTGTVKSRLFRARRALRDQLVAKGMNR
ncbi:MAG TPA: sigma-70 family RNA polymerase sigma factor [Thermoanaerobaculia bacterium]|jgi:RNA polymerase sigma-70 factor (ECF subfamily)|nr:sigma-70 family RNA polymerase sigma factor [Thermoanaerobaculia bacterium]